MLRVILTSHSTFNGRAKGWDGCSVEVTTIYYDRGASGRSDDENEAFDNN